MLAVRTGATLIYIIGKIIYRDELKNVRRTGFARVFSMDTGRFAPIKNDPDYEYEE